jgi:metal transporter CNNM
MAMAVSAARSRAGNGSSLQTARLVCMGLFHAFAPIVTALPLPFGGMAEAFKKDADEDLPKSPDNPQLWLYLGIAIALVLAGGVFAGLTIA